MMAKAGHRALPLVPQELLVQLVLKAPLVLEPLVPLVFKVTLALRVPLAQQVQLEQQEPQDLLAVRDQQQQFMMLAVTPVGILVCQWVPQHSDPQTLPRVF
jgi:hypothetical protein